MLGIEGKKFVIISCKWNTYPYSCAWPRNDMTSETCFTREIASRGQSESFFLSIQVCLRTGSCALNLLILILLSQSVYDVNAKSTSERIKWNLYVFLNSWMQLHNVSLRKTCNSAQQNSASCCICQLGYTTRLVEESNSWKVHI
jgi:hypothetical protein